MIRRSNKKDLSQIKELLKQLTIVGDIEDHQINNNIFDNVYVYCIDDSVIGCATILIEDKIIHNGGRVGHIEDVVVGDNHRGKGIGKLLIEYCSNIAKEAGCYKVILDCNTNNVKFYENCGFTRSGVCMRLDM